ncbi:Fc.00g043400.m01.CDS01 [Cosmosporella sp. VM-42]
MALIDPMERFSGHEDIHVGAFLSKILVHVHAEEQISELVSISLKGLIGMAATYNVENGLF